MNVKKLETEKNYDKEGYDRVWYKIVGYDWKTNIDLDGVYGFINGAVVNVDGEDVTGNELLAVEHAMEQSEAARAMRAVNSPAQQQAARENGKKGGRPSIDKIAERLNIRIEKQGKVNGVNRYKVWRFNGSQNAYIFDGSYTYKELREEL